MPQTWRFCTGRGVHRRCGKAPTQESRLRLRPATARRSRAQHLAGRQADRSGRGSKRTPAQPGNGVTNNADVDHAPLQRRIMFVAPNILRRNGVDCETGWASFVRVTNLGYSVPRGEGHLPLLDGAGSKDIDHSRTSVWTTTCARRPCHSVRHRQDWCFTPVA